MRRVLCLSLCLGVLGIGGTARAADDEFEAIKKQYLREVRDPSMEVRTGAHVTFAATGDVAALDELRRQYGRVDKPEAQQQYLIASIASTYLRQDEHRPAYAEWRRRRDKARDAWLWFQALRVEAERGDPETVVKVALSSTRNCFLRAAALEALAAAGDPAALDAAAGVFAKLPPEPVARAVLVESIAAVLFAHRDRRGEVGCRTVLTKLIRQLDKKATSARTKLVLARRLRAIFGIDEMYLEARPWLDHLLGKAEKVDWGRYARPEKNTFFGLEATGIRIAYVIDMSTSMLDRVTVRELDDLKKIRRPRNVTREAKRAKDESSPPDRIDWKNVETRFDAARACLRFSLQGLRPDQFFTVLGFATKSGFIPPCTGMMRASPKNVRAMVKALDRCAAGSLFGGSTNLHGGIHRAFKTIAGGMLGEYEYVEPVGIKEGCDTVFLLSDGSPCWDDWATSVAGLGGVAFGVTDPGTVAFGNYSTAHQIVDDVRRLNLFRKAEIHCVGLGDGPVALLGAIAEAGMGRSRVVGGDALSAKDLTETLRPGKQTAEAKALDTLRDDADPVQRDKAAARLAARGSIDAVPALIDALDDEAPRVRKAAYVALKTITGQDIPYRRDMDYDQRMKAQQTWRAWYALNEKKLREQRK